MMSVSEKNYPIYEEQCCVSCLPSLCTFARLKATHITKQKENHWNIFIRFTSISDTAVLAQGHVTCRLIGAACLVSGQHSKYNNNADILKSSRIYSPPALVLGAGHPDWLRCVTRPKNCSFQKDTKTNDVDIRHWFDHLTKFKQEISSEVFETNILEINKYVGGCSWGHV